MASDATLSRWEPTAKWESRYREVRDAAARSFAEKGYLGASTKDIADRLGIRAASLYYYLPSKDAALEALRRVAKNTEKRLRNAKDQPDFGLNFYVIDKQGRFAGVSMSGRSRYAVCDETGPRLEDCEPLFS